MSTKQAKTASDQDPILQAFEETKGEQLDLLEIAEEKSQEQKKKQRNTLGKKKEVVQEKTQEETVWFTGADGVQYTEEEWHSPAVHNGPSRMEVEEWKERHGNVYFTPYDSEVYIWRVLRRPEYREIIRDTTLNALDREELFTEKCVLYPRNFNLETIKKSRAGVASLLSEMIMEKSGFVAQSAPIKL